MAIITTHTLNSVDGTHAGGIGVALFQLPPSGPRVQLIEAETDAGGRLKMTLDAARVDTASDYEIVLQTGAYFDTRLPSRPGMHLVRQVVVRFAMPDPEASYHIPFMIAPNSHSVWYSS